jgi:hypothetical protein
MVDARWCCENINSGHFKFSSVLGEIKELVQARSLAEFKDEFGDVLYFSYCWLYCNLGINLPMIGAMGSVEKFTERLLWWEEIFRINKLEFDPKYLINGSNYTKFYKVILALDLARDEQGEPK